MPQPLGVPQWRTPLVAGDGVIDVRWQAWLSNLFAIVRGIHQADLAGRIVTTSGVLLPTDAVIFADATDGQIVLTLGAPALFNQVYYIKKIDRGPNPVIVAGPGPELPYTLADPFNVGRFACDGTSFYLL